MKLLAVFCGSAPILGVGCSVRAGFLSLWEHKCVLINPEERVWEN